MPPLDITAYTTFSTRFTDVLPMPPDSKDPNLPMIRERAVLDLRELPLAHRPLRPLELIRRWESPAGGKVHLQGTFALQSGETIACEVRLLESASEKEHVLFTQNLEAGVKPSTGIEGTFPLSKEDQLLFVASGPAVVTGGELRLHIRLEQDGEVYDSIEDFSETQGSSGWYYEQRTGADRTLLVWNPEPHRWESPDTRSFLNAESMICRCGELGDAFPAAGKFFDEIRLLGISQLLFILRGWSDHARIAPPPSATALETVWGTAAALQRLTEREIAAGNGIADLPALPARAATEAFSVRDSVHAVQESLSQAAGKMRFNTVVLENLPTAHPASGWFFPHENDDSRERSSRYSIRKTDEFLAALKAALPIPLILWGEEGDARLDFFLAHTLPAVVLPMNRFCNMRGIVDEDLRIGRRVAPRIGFGSIDQFFDEQRLDRKLDPRLLPLDYYYTATVASARVPYWSDAFRFAKMTDQDLRRNILETFSLLQPPAKEYLDPQNNVEQIEYLTVDGKAYSVEKVLFLENPDQAPRIKIRYTNGLRIYANRSDRPWKPEEEELSDDQIEPDGFLAVNGKTGLFTIIGRQSLLRFSASRAADMVFVDSRDGRMLSYPPLGTDGMVRLWKDAKTGRRNFASLHATEVSWLEDQRPILRSNERLDCVVNWLSVDSVELRLLKAVKENLMEYFDIPETWWDENNGSISIMKKQEENPNPAEPVNWSVVAFDKHQGIRIPTVRTGDIYLIDFIKKAKP